MSTIKEKMGYFPGIANHESIFLHEMQRFWVWLNRESFFHKHLLPLTYLLYLLYIYYIRHFSWADYNSTKSCDHSFNI